jgi:FGGY-family pentulose kinase
MADTLYLGIDVGTGSVRAGLFDDDGQRVGTGSHPIKISKPADDFVEQSSEDIWRATSKAIAGALAESGAAPDRIAGIGFDATCSLVVLDADNRPVPVSAHASTSASKDVDNVIVWMDHRAIEQTERINQVPHEVLRFVGGRISPEMQLPKILWLKEQLPESFARAARLLDLADFMSFRATGDDTRSLCTAVCKWTYLGHDARWADDFLTRIGLDELTRDEHARIGQCIRPMGERVGSLSVDAARELGLVPGIAVGVGIIDAHAGGLGLLGAAIDEEPPAHVDLERRLALICGTSSCHMAVSREPRYVPGVWGPYYSAMVPGYWLTEGGQSATGALIDHVIHTHVRGEALAREARANGTTVYARLNQVLLQLGASSQHRLTEDLHVLPYFHGNRSPRADPSLRGMQSGLRLSDNLESLALLYLATIQAIAHGTRHILEAFRAQGYQIDCIFATGGDTKNPAFVREHADITGCRIVLPRESEAVLLGSALLGAVASGRYPSVVSAMGAMNHVGEIIRPQTGEVARYHARKYAVFQRMYLDQRAYSELMRSSG